MFPNRRGVETALRLPRRRPFKSSAAIAVMWLDPVIRCHRSSWAMVFARKLGAILEPGDAVSVVLFKAARLTCPRCLGHLVTH